MSSKDTIRILLERGGEGDPLGPGEWRRVAARIAWAREIMAAWAEAQRQMDDRCRAAVDRLSDEEFEKLCDEEQAKVDAIRARIDAVIERDQWPRELYFSGI